MTQSQAAVKLEAHLLLHKDGQLLEAKGDAGVLLSLMMRMMYRISYISSNSTLRQVIQSCKT